MGQMQTGISISNGQVSYCNRNFDSLVILSCLVAVRAFFACSLLAFQSCKADV